MPKRPLIIFFIIVAMIFQIALVNTVALAEGKVTLLVRLNPSVIQPGEPFEVIYDITNFTDKVIRVRIREEIYNNITNDMAISVIEKTVGAGQQQEISSGDEGEGYKAIDGYITYLAEYQLEGQNEWIVLGQGTFDIFNIGFKVSYDADESRVKKGENVEYTAVVESTSNVVLSNVTVIDSQLGEIGKIPKLRPGEKEKVKRKFKLEDTTESYIILRYQDPMAVRGEIEQEFPDARVKVEVEEEEPIYSLEVNGSVDKQHITSEQEVSFTLKIKNTGNVTLNNIQCTDWNGNVFYEIVKLLPGQETTATYKAAISSEGEYTITCSGIPEDGAEKVQAYYTVEISKVEAGVEIERKFAPEKAAPGDIVTLSYIIRNTGQVTLKDVLVDEPELGSIASFSSLKPGEEKVFSLEKEMDDDGIVSRTVLTAKEEITGAPYRYEAEELLIPAETSEKVAHVSIDVEANPSSLKEAGTVQVRCTVKNDGEVVLKNIEVFVKDSVKERNIGMGSMLVLNPGEQQTFNLSHLRVEQTGSFVVVVKAEDEKGNDLEFKSQPFEVVVGMVDEAQKQNGVDAGRVTLLKVAFMVVIFLIILTAGTLIYLVRDSLPFFRRRRSLKHRAARQN